MCAVEFLADPADFLALAGDVLAARPVESTVVATVADRLARHGGEAGPGNPYWWAVVRDASGAVVGAAMRTAPFAPYPAYVLPMPEEAARALAVAVADRPEPLGAVNGALPAAWLVAEESARRAGAGVRVLEETRLWELGTLVEPVGVPGRLRQPAPDEIGLIVEWFDDFGRAAAAQAGRAEPHPSVQVDEDEMKRRVAERRVHVWDVDGEVVHVTGDNPPAFGVARIGPVYTPEEHRGRGYASAAVGEVARRLRDGGARVCLFTDLSNPVSNRVYAALGFEPLVDSAHHVIG